MAQRWKDGPCSRLDQALERAALSSASVGRKVGLSAPTISLYRSGGRTPNADTLAAILELCGGSADDVLGLSGHVAAENAQLRKALAGVGELVGRLEPAGRPGKRGPGG